MIDRLSDIIADFYISKNIINSSDKAVYKLGLELIINDIITFSLITLLSSLLFHIRYAFEFLVVFCTTRIYCGGYHAPKAYLCRLIMIAVFMSVMISSNYVKSINAVRLYVLLLISFVVILPMIPVKHPNKKLTKKDVKKGRENGIVLYIIFAVCSAIVYTYINVQDGIIICLSLCAVSVLVIIGKIVYEGRCSYEEDDK